MVYRGRSGGVCTELAIAIVVPTLDRPEWVGAVIEDLHAQLPSHAEVALVDQSAPDGVAATADRLQRLADPRFHHVVRPARGLPAARNAGLAATTAPVVLFLDDDVRVLPGCVQAHLARYAERRVGAVVGRIVERVVRPNSRRTANRVALGGRVITNLAGLVPRRVRALKGANMSIRRAAIEAVGGFDRNYLGTALLEDADIAARIRRAGFQVWFEPRAEVLHLSAPAGGVRQSDPQRTERWRFHNTAYYVRRHRGVLGAPALWATFTAIAARRALQWQRPDALADLLAALHEGWALAGGPPDTGTTEEPG